MAKSTKPKKPYPTFPLTAHPNGQWCKTIRYKLHYFGPWDDPDGALKRYQTVAADLHAGRPRSPTLPSSGLTIKDVCNDYLKAQERKVNEERMTKQWWNDLRRLLRRFLKAVGETRLVSDLRPTDFETYRGALGKRLGVYALTRHLTAIRSVFKHAFDSDLIERPIRFGPQFRNPTRSDLRRARAKRERERGLKMFQPTEIIRILDLCDATDRPALHYLNFPTMKACVLLGINGAYTNIDCAKLPMSLVDLDNAVINYSRVKTGIPRLVTLWPETVAALRVAMTGHRSSPANTQAVTLALLTVVGEPVAKEYITKESDGTIRNVTRDEFLSEDFRAILQHLGLHRKGIGFSALRPTFRTLADEVHDDNAARLVMGHEIPGMDGIYVKKIGEDRVRNVTNHVRSRVFSQSSP